MATAWWAALPILLKILWGITITATVIFIIESIMTFLGADSSSDVDFDIDTDFSVDGSTGMGLYTFRNFVNFLLGFGWTSVLLYDRFPSKGLLFLAATLVGVLLVAVVMWLFKWLWGMQQSGTIDIFKAAPGCTGKAYLTIPAERSGFGKVQISIGGSIREYNAVTDSEEIKTGTPIKVIEAIDSETLLVEAPNSLII